MRHRPLATAAAATLVLGLIAGPAASTASAAATTPAAGSATSALEILSLALAAHRADVGTVALTSDTTSGSPVSKVVVTPVKVDGTAYGEQTVTPASSPATVPVVDSSAVVPSALSGLLSVKSPAFDASASDTDGASSKAGAGSLGSISVLGIPLKLDGSVDVSSLVNGTNAVGAKTIAVKNLALPSIADLLAALGLDLPKVPLDTLTDLVDGLHLTSTAVTTAQQALTTAESTIKTQLDAAQAAVDAAQAQLNTANAALAPAQSALTQAQQASAAATAAQQAAAAAITAVLPVGTTLDQYLLLFPASSLVTTYNSATAQVASTATALAAAQAAVDAAQKAVADATAALSGLLATLNGLLATVQPQIDALLAAITALLDGTPLVSIDSISVETQALVTSASAGGQSAKVVGGEVTGLKVLGTDVLNNVLGSSTVDLVDLAGSTLTSVTNAVNGLTGTLSSVLSNVPSLPSLSIPAPQIGLLTKTTSTSIAGGFGIAKDSVSGLTVTIPAITLPAAVALPNAATLPAISGLPGAGALSTAVVGDLLSQAVTIKVITLTEQATFHAASTTAPTTTPPTTTPPATAPPEDLATTGLPAGIALFATLLVGGAYLLRRRLADGSDI